MLRPLLPCIIGIAALLAGCTGRQAPEPTPAVVLALVFEPAQAGDALVHGRRDPDLATTLPGNRNLGAALRQCGQAHFDLLERGAAYWEAVSFPSTAKDGAIIRCVADKVSFDFVPYRTMGPTITASSKFDPITNVQS